MERLLGRQSPGPGGRIPAGERPRGVRPLRGLPPRTGRGDRLAPAGRPEAGREVGQRREDEQALAGAGCGTSSHWTPCRAGSSLRATGRPLDAGWRWRPKTSRSRSSSRGPQRSRSRRPNARSRPLSARSRASAPVAGSGPAGTSRATTALRNSGWSVTPTGAVAYRRETPREARARQRGEGVDRRGERRRPRRRGSRRGRRTRATRRGPDRGRVIAWSALAHAPRIRPWATSRPGPPPRRGARRGPLARRSPTRAPELAERHRGRVPRRPARRRPRSCADGRRDPVRRAAPDARGRTCAGDATASSSWAPGRCRWRGRPTGAGSSRRQRGPRRRALANNRYSADAVAVAGSAVLRGLPALPADNALPRWLTEVAGYAVADLRGATRLQLDLDTPLDLRPPGRAAGRAADVRDAAARLPGPVRAAGRPAGGARRPAGRARRGRADLAGTLAALERARPAGSGRSSRSAGLRAAAGSPRRAGLGRDRPVRARRGSTPRIGRPRQRPPRSILGLLLDRDGPEALGAAPGRARRRGRRRHAGPAGPPAGRRRGGLAGGRGPLRLRPPAAGPGRRPVAAGADVSAADAPIPVLLGGHTLVGPGLRARWRREPAREPTGATAVTAALEAAIRAEIAAERPDPVRRASWSSRSATRRAATTPRRPPARPAGGDFLTAPELHPIFGGGAGPPARRGVGAARAARPVRARRVRRRGGDARPSRSSPGSAPTARRWRTCLRYAPVELNPHRLAELRRAARRSRPGRRSTPGRARGPGPPRSPASSLANEFLDALPVHVVEVREGAAARGPRGLGPRRRVRGGARRAVRRRRSATRLAALARGRGRARRGAARWRSASAVDAWAARGGRGASPRVSSSSSTTGRRRPTCTARGGGPARS